MTSIIPVDSSVEVFIACYIKCHSLISSLPSYFPSSSHAFVCPIIIPLLLPSFLLSLSFTLQLFSEHRFKDAVIGERQWRSSVVQRAALFQHFLQGYCKQTYKYTLTFIVIYSQMMYRSRLLIRAICLTMRLTTSLVCGNVHTYTTRASMCKMHCHR